MKNTFLALIFSIAACASYAQITITKNDMPLVNDTLRVSNTNTIGTSDPTLTGANHSWDYTHLVPLTQTIDTFVSVTTTPFAYQFYFNNIILYPNTKADLAVPVATPVLTTGLTLEDVFNYYKKPTGEYTQVGFGAKINGVPTSVRFDSLDIIYRFPMNYGNKDSCVSKYGLNVPTLMYYGQRKKRVNEVDGWGTLKTPFGTFQTLRVKSTLYTTDTIYLNSLSFGMKINRPTQIEYKWLGVNSRIPLLQIITTAGATPVVTSVVYRDSLRGTILSVQPTIASKEDNINIFADSKSHTINIFYEASSNQTLNAELYDLAGRKITTLLNETVEAGTCKFGYNIEQLNLASGIYVVKMLVNNKNLISKKIIVDIE